MKKIILLSIFVMILVISAHPCYSQQEVQEMEKGRVMGTVVSTDYVGSKMVVSTYQGDLLFYVPDNTVITLGEDTRTLSDINIGDVLTIEYYKDSSGKLETISIIDSNMGNAF
ncbi:MAG: hypothetical protein ABIH18_02500 [Candidatus Omnitrophota bacterium]